MHAVLEDDATDDHGDRGRELPGEAKSSGRGGDVLGVNLRLQRKERSLKKGSGTKAGNDLVADDAGPGTTAVGKVDKEADAECEEERTHPDGRKVLTGFFDDDAHHGGSEREGENERHEIDAREDGGGTEDGLEVEREEEDAADEDHAVGEADP